MKFDPKIYQLPAIEFIKETPRCAVHAGIGSGKTVITLTAMDDLSCMLDVNRVLFLAPLNVILNTVPDEIAKWDHTRHITFSTLHGTNKNEALKDDSFLHLLNYEGVEWFLQSGDRQYYDMVVVDESHATKGHNTKRFRMLSQILHRVRRVVLMSGTPIGNSLLDLWAQYYLIDGGDRLLRSYEHFRATYFDRVGYTGYKWEAYDWAEVAIIKKVQDITFQVHPDDVKLTELVETVLPCTLPDDIMAYYRDFERNYFLEIGEAEIEAFNAVSLVSKLRQLANGFLYYGDTNVHRRKTTVVHDAKFKLLQKFVSNARGNIMVVATFAEDFEALDRVFPGIPCIHGRVTPKQRRERILAWNSGALPILAIHPRSVGTGLNLQDGGCQQIWVSPDWSYLSKNQTVGRVHRTGQEKDVLIEVISAVGTVDEMILEALQTKTLTTESFARKLRLYRRAVLEGVTP